MRVDIAADVCECGGVEAERKVRRTKHAGRVDANHIAVRAALGGMGATCQSLGMVGDGCPDFVVGYRGRTYLLEVKDGKRPPSERKLTAAQERWHSWWRGTPVRVVTSPEEAIEAVCGIRDDTGWRTALGDA